VNEINTSLPLSYSIDKVPPKFNIYIYIFFAMSQFDCLPKMEGSTLKFTIPPLWPTYISERRVTLAEAYFWPGLIALPKKTLPIEN
jgi:hypothetical protein